MIIDFYHGRFHVLPGAEEYEACQHIPTSKWEPITGHWSAYPTREAATYLMGWQQSATHEARTMMLKLASPPLPRGTLPANWAFKTNPFPHQLDTLLRGLGQESFAYFLEPRLGKTWICIQDMGVHFTRKNIIQALVLCPNSITSIWAEQIKEHSSIPMDVWVYSPAHKQGFKHWITRGGSGMKVLLASSETLSSGDGLTFITMFLKMCPTGVYVDESTWFNNPFAARTEALISLRQYCTIRRICTGTPITRSMADAWASFQFLDPAILNQDYYPFRHWSSVGDPNFFMQLVAPYVSVYRKIDCATLPQKVYQVRRVGATPEQKAAYKAMLGASTFEPGQGHFHALVRLLRCQQVTGGFLGRKLSPPIISQPSGSYDEDVAELVNALTDPQPIPGGNPKITELLHIAEEYPGKTIVWARFRSEIQAIVRALGEAHGQDSVVEYHGGVDKDARTKARVRFQHNPDCRFIVLQANTGSLGIALSVASVAVYFSNSWSVLARIQSEERCYDLNTKESPIYIDLVCDKDWVDYRIVQCLKEGKDFTVGMMNQLEEASQRHKEQK